MSCSKTQHNASGERTPQSRVKHSTPEPQGLLKKQRDYTSINWFVIPLHCLLGLGDS